jgi:hypothetical protein
VTTGELLALGAFLLRASSYSSPEVAVIEAEKVLQVIFGKRCGDFVPPIIPNPEWPEKDGAPMSVRKLLEACAQGDGCDYCTWPLSSHAAGAAGEDSLTIRGDVP